MQASAILFNSFGRLRSGWRFGVFLFWFLAAGTIFGAVIQAAGKWLQLNLERDSTEFLILNGVVSVTLALGIGWLCARLLEDLPFRSLGFSFRDRWWAHLAAGLALGGTAIGMAVIIAAAAAGLQFRMNTDPTAESIITNLFVSFIVLAILAASEEALFRGYVLQTFLRAGFGWHAILATSVIFGILHSFNPHADLISTLNTMLAGIWFGAAFLKSRSLWFPLGLHWIWNWAMGAVFGIEISGLTNLVDAPLLREIDNGPAWLTGENYGIEAGLPATLAILISTAAIYFLPFPEASDEMVELTSREVPTASAR